MTSRPFSPRPGIACPRCGWQPYVGARWVCAPDGCGTAWDTFETGARCPGCDARFVWTDCLACGRRSPHQDWYGGSR